MAPGALDRMNAVTTSVPNRRKAAAVALGQPFQSKVTALDQWGNTASTHAATVYFSSTDLPAQLADDYTFGTVDGRAHTFDAVLQARGAGGTLTIDDFSGTVTASGTVAIDKRAQALLCLSGMNMTLCVGDELLGFFAREGELLPADHEKRDNIFLPLDLESADMVGSYKALMLGYRIIELDEAHNATSSNLLRDAGGADMPNRRKLLPPPRLELGTR